MSRRAGPLHGVPTAIKDLFDFKPGWPATFGGDPRAADYWSTFAAPGRERMEAAGAIIVGKTNSPVMGFRGDLRQLPVRADAQPVGHDPQHRRLVGRRAAAVADGMLPIAEGTDGGGSVRIPAAWCGVYGYKQSFGRVPFGHPPERVRRRPARSCSRG